MQKINKFIEKNILNIISIFVILQPVLDIFIASNISIISPVSSFSKLLFMFFLIYYISFISKTKYKKKSLMLLLSIFIYLVLFFIINRSYNNISNTLRTFYLPIIFICLFNIFKEKDAVNNKYIITSLAIYTSVILIAYLTNTSFDSYSIAKEGSLGWYNSANEISAIIAIILPLLFESIFKKINFIKILFLAISIFACFKVGTRVPLVSLGLCLIVYYFKYIKILLKKGYKKIFGTTIISTIIILIAFVLILPQTPIYKNIIIHTKYLGLNNIQDIFRDSKTIDHFIFSERLSFLSDTNTSYINSDIPNKLIGIGYDSNNKMIEMDPFDIFYRHGIVGFIIYFGSIVYIIVLSDKKFNYRYILPMFMVLFTSIFSGHVLIAPSVSIVVTIILLKFVMGCDLMKKKLLFCSYDLNVGGIENALLNLLNNINFKKYDVTLLLERKQGIFLDRVPKNIKIIEYKVSENKNVLIRKFINLCKQIKWIIFNYNRYDFSCCYATYSLPCNLISRVSSKNCIIYIHSNYKYVYNNDINKLKEFFNQRNLDKFRKIVFVSNESKNDLCKIYPQITNKSIVINNLVNSKKILELSEKKVNVDKPKNKKTFVFVGRFEEKSKRLTRLIKVFSLLNKKLSNIELWMIGNGSDYELVEKIIKKEKLESIIKLFGEQENPYPYMKLADYVILTSDYEGFPVVYNEAIVLNKTIITTIDVSDDYIQIPNKFGYVVSKDELEMANEICEILSNNIKLETLNFENINKEKIVKLEKIFDEVI